MDDSYSILHNQPMQVPGEEGLRDIRIVEAIRQSVAEAGRWVALNG